MKLRVKIIIIITILIVIVGWNAHKRDIVKVNETLHGESENWRASYTVDGFVEFTKSKEDRLGIEQLNKNKEIKIIVTWDGTNGSSEEIILK